MAEIRTLAPHDALPPGSGIVIMRRFDEDAPDRTVIELIITTADHREHTALAIHPNGQPMSEPEALALARQRAAEEHLPVIWLVDRTGGTLEQDVLAHHGDHSFTGKSLDDDDLEDGEHGTDLRDRRNDGGPRRF
jgi:hypothetical protein